MFKFLNLWINIIITRNDTFNLLKYLLWNEKTLSWCVFFSIYQKSEICNIILFNSLPLISALLLFSGRCIFTTSTEYVVLLFHFLEVNCVFMIVSINHNSTDTGCVQLGSQNKLAGHDNPSGYVWLKQKSPIRVIRKNYKVRCTFYWLKPILTSLSNLDRV